MPSYVVEIEGTFYREYLVCAPTKEEAEERALDAAQNEYDPDRFNISLAHSRKAEHGDLGKIEALDVEDAIKAGINVGRAD